MANDTPQNTNQPGGDISPDRTIRPHTPITELDKLAGIPESELNALDGLTIDGGSDKKPSVADTSPVISLESDTTPGLKKPHKPAPVDPSTIVSEELGWTDSTGSVRKSWTKEGGLVEEPKSSGPGNKPIPQSPGTISR